MKGLSNNRNDVVPLRERRDVEPSFEQPLAMQLGELRMLNEKLLYRIQQLERREKSTRNLIDSLRRQVSSLKKLANPARTVSPVNQPPEESPPQEQPGSPDVATPTRTVRPLSSADFGSGVNDLEKGRH